MQAVANAMKISKSRRDTGGFENDYNYPVNDKEAWHSYWF